MRTVDFRRHSFTKKGDARGRGSHLSAEGVAAARGVGARLGLFDFVIASTSPRTAETAVAMGYAVDDLVEMTSPVETGEIEFHAWREWADPFSALRERARNSRAIDQYLGAQVERVLAAVAGVSDGGRVLVVGHGGWLEAVVAGVVDGEAAAAIGGSLWHLDSVRVAISDAGRASVAAVDRFRPPAQVLDERPAANQPSPIASRAGSEILRRKRQTHSNVRDGHRLVWYTENLWPLAAELPVFEVALDGVKAWTGAGALDEDCWFGGRPATLREVARHSARIDATSLEYPIILNDDGTLMDGGHRLCKALLQGCATVAAVQFPTMPPPDEVHDLPAR